MSKLAVRILYEAVTLFVIVVLIVLLLFLNPRRMD